MLHVSQAGWDDLLGMSQSFVIYRFIMLCTVDYKCRNDYSTELRWRQGQACVDSTADYSVQGDILYVRRRDFDMKELIASVRALVGLVLAWSIC